MSDQVGNQNVGFLTTRLKCEQGSREMSRVSGFPTRYHTNQALQLQKIARGFKFFTAKLICTFVFAYAKCRFSHDAAQIVQSMKRKLGHWSAARARGMKFRIYGVDGLYPGYVAKIQLISCAVRLCFRICKKQVFLRHGFRRNIRWFQITHWLTLFKLWNTVI